MSPSTLFRVGGALLLAAAISEAGDLRYGVYIKGGDDEGWDYKEDGGAAATVGRKWPTDAFSLQKCPFPVEFRCHFAKNGWARWTKLGDYQTSVGKPLEAIEFRFPKGEPEKFGYVMMGRVHVQEIGWMNPTRVKSGVVLGTTGKAWRLEAIQLGVEKIKR